MRKKIDIVILETFFANENRQNKSKTLTNSICLYIKRIIHHKLVEIFPEM